MRNSTFSLNLELRNVEREVYVARGDFSLTPLDGQDDLVQSLHLFFLFSFGKLLK